MKARSALRFPLAIYLLGSPFALSLPGFAITWEGGVSADWSDPANWEGGLVPDAFTPAEFSAVINGGVATPSSLVVLSGSEESASALWVSADVLTLDSAVGQSVLNLVAETDDASSVTLVVRGGLLDLESPTGVIPSVSSSLTLGSNLTVRTHSGSIGTNEGDDASLILAGGRLEVSYGATVEIGNFDGSATGRVVFQPDGYSNFVANGATVLVQNGGIFDTNHANAFAAIGTLDLQSGGTARLGSYFQLWTDHLNLAEGSNFSWATENEYAWSQLAIQVGGFHIDGGVSAVAVFGESPLIDGSKSFRLTDGALSVGDGQTLLVNGTFSGFQRANDSYWDPAWFANLDVAGIELEGSGQIDFSGGSIGLTGQGLVIGPDGLFQDADDGMGGPNVAGNLTLGPNRGIAVTAGGGPSIDGSEAGHTIIRAGATLSIDGGAFFTHTLEQESAGDTGTFIDFSGLTRVDVTLGDAPAVEFRDGNDHPVYRLFNVEDGYGFEDVGNSSFESEVALSFGIDGAFEGVNVGGSITGDGKLDFRSGLFGIGTDLLFTGDSRSTVSPDANFVIGADQQLVTLGTARIGTEFSNLRQVGITLDGGSLTAAAIRIGPGGTLDFTAAGGMVHLQDNYTNDSNWVVGAVDGSGNGEFQGDFYGLGAIDSHLGEALNGAGGSPGDGVLGENFSIATENLTLLDGARLTLDGGNLVVLHEVRLGNDGARLEVVRGQLTLDQALVTVGRGGLLGDSVLVGSALDLSIRNLSLAVGGTLSVDQGSLTSENFHAEAGMQIDFQAGSIVLGPSLTFGAADQADRPFGDSLVLDEHRSLAIHGATVLENGSSVTVAGGGFDPRGGISVAEGASLEWSSGSLGGNNNTFTLSNAGEVSLTLTDGETRNLRANIGNSGTVSIQGADAATLNFQGAITNSGVWKVSVPAGQTSTVQYGGSFRLTGAGSYISDPATHEFTDLTVQDQASLEGVSGDQFVVGGNFNNTSTATWNVSNAELIFTGGPHQVSGLTSANQAFGQITLQNDAALAGNLTVFHTLNVGSNVGIVGDLTVEGMMNLQIDDLSAGLAITGNFTLNGVLNLFFAPDFVFIPDQTIQILDLNGGPYDFTGKNVNFPGEAGTFDFTTGAFVVTIPEPSISMLSLMAVGLGLGRRRRC
jgi:hypothetical protein